MSQLVTGEYLNDKYQTRFEIEVLGNRLTIVGLSTLGVTLFTLVQMGDQITLESRLEKYADIDPRYTLFDIYLTYSPEPALDQALRRNGLKLYVEPNNRARIVRDSNGEMVATVIYSEDVTLISHAKPNYTLHVSQLAAPKLR